MNLIACLPPHLQGPTTAITAIAAGLSGAGVYRVEADGQRFVLKVAADSDPAPRWRSRLAIQERAASAALAPAIVHVDEAHRAVVSAFVADRGFAARYGDPRTRDAAIAQLGQTLRRVHDLPLPADTAAVDPRQQLGQLASGLAAIAAPAFAADAVQRVLTETPPASERPTVLSHNDVNPTNLVDDGEHVMLLDWDTAGANEPFYDLAAISVFFRMDDASCRQLLAAHDGAAASHLPARFSYDRRLVAVLCGTMFLQLARQAGHSGATTETFDTAPSLVEVYQRMRAGVSSVATSEGRWQFGLALLKDSFAM